MNEVERLKQRLFNEIEGADNKLLSILDSVIVAYNAPAEEEKSNGELYRLVYTSARRSNCAEEEIDKILEASRRNNSKLGVTGILVHTKDRFLQVLEGKEEVVKKLYDKIEMDDRHGGSVMRFCEPVSERHFPDWDMAGKKIDEKKIQFKTAVDDEKMALYQSMFDGNLRSYKDEGMRVLKTFLMVS